VPPLFGAFGRSAALFKARAVRSCVHLVPGVCSNSLTGRAGEDDEAVVKDRAGNANGFHSYSRACSGQSMRELSQATDRCRRHRDREVCATDIEPKSSSTKAAAEANGAWLGEAPRRQALGSQGLGPSSAESPKVSCLDGARAEVQNFRSIGGVRKAEVGAQAADQFEAAVGAVLAKGEAGQDEAVRPLKAGANWGVELQ
jgi:hypothetical protein